MLYKQLGHKHTHLKLRDRAKLLLVIEHNGSRPMPPDFWQDVNRLIHLRGNAVRYQHTHFPAWYDIPEQIRKQMAEDYPLSGTGMAEMNTMLYLFKQAEEAEQEYTNKHRSVYQPSEGEIDALVNQYLESRKTA